MNNPHQNMNYLLDEFAPYKKLPKKKEYKLRPKPWINKNILAQMKKRDDLLHRYCEEKERDSLYVQANYYEYKSTENSVTKMKRK